MVVGAGKAHAVGGGVREHPPPAQLRHLADQSFGRKPSKPLEAGKPRELSHLFQGPAAAPVGEGLHADAGAKALVDLHEGIEGVVAAGVVPGAGAAHEEPFGEAVVDVGSCRSAGKEAGEATGSLDQRLVLGPAQRRIERAFVHAFLLPG